MPSLGKCPCLCVCNLDQSESPLEQSTSSNASSFASHLLTSGIGIILFSLLSGRTTFGDSSGFEVLPSGTYGIIFGVLLCWMAVWKARLNLTILRLTPEGGVVTLLVYFFSDWLTRGYNLFQGPNIRGEIFLLSILSGIILLTNRVRWLYGIALIAPLILLGTFLRHTQGLPIVSDDHASFIYRLLSLKENFPFIPYFSPLWNGGMDARDFFATGALNIFLICAPLIYLFDVSKIYSFIIAVPLFLILPLSIYFASRILKLSTLASVCASLLSVSSSLLWYRWGLKYGTLGFVTTTSLVPVVFALATKMLAPTEQLSRTEAALLVILSSLMLLWTPSGLALLPVALYVVYSLPSLLRIRRVRRIALALILLNVPWIMLFLSVSKVGKFIHTDHSNYQMRADETFQQTTTQLSSPPVTATEVALKRGNFGAETTLKIARETAISMNPLLLVLALPGLLFLRGHRRVLFIAIGVWLFLVGAVLAPLKPQLELDRMLVLLGILTSIPCGAALAHLFECARSGKMLRLFGASFVGGFFLTGPFITSAVVTNRTIEQFTVKSPLTSEIAEQIHIYGGEGRTLFSGFILHDLNNAHIAPLVFWSGKPLMASSPFHNVWRYRQIIPLSFIAQKRTGGVEKYLDLYNVSAVMAHEKEWRDYFNSKPELYSPVWRKDRFTLYTRTTYPHSYVMSGEVEGLVQDSRSIKFTVKSQDVILRFNYFPFLRAKGCSIAPEQIAEEVRFIKLSNCTPGTQVTVDSVGALSRLWKEVAP